MKRELRRKIGAEWKISLLRNLHALPLEIAEIGFGSVCRRRIGELEIQILPLRR